MYSLHIIQQHWLPLLQYYIFAAKLAVKLDEVKNLFKTSIYALEVKFFEF